MEERSGVKFHEAQVALARQWIGTPIAGAETQTKVAIKSADQSDAAPTVSGDTKVKTQEIDLPPSAEVARHIIGTFERGAEGWRCLPGDMAPRDSQDLMAYPFFSLAKSRRVAPIDFRAGNVTIRVEGTQEHGELLWRAFAILDAAEAPSKVRQALE